MQMPVLTNKTIRVQSIRSQNPVGYGGAIFTGTVIDDIGQIVDAKQTVVVKAPFSLLNRIRVELGQWWELYGETETYTNDINGYRLKEIQLLPHQMQLVRPSGEHIVRLMADNKAFEGIGDVKARKLWERFGNKLYSILDNSDISSLSQVVSTETAHHLLLAWQQYGDTKTLHWFVQNGFTVEMGKKLLAYYGKETSEKIENDPYRMLAFSGRWKNVDAMAIKTFGLKPDDPRRLRGAIEEALYRRFALGDTAVPLKMIQNSLIKLLQTNEINWAEMTSKAMISGYGQGCFVISDNGDDLVLHALGPYFMEKNIASEIVNRVKIQSTVIDGQDISQELLKFEQQSGFSLNSEQHLAVTSTVSSVFSIITGGAGTGKTTVLEALYRLYDKVGITVHQMALSGRATKRMIEATNREGTTIAGFLRNVDTSEFNDQTVIVIDEASMIDVGIMHRILQHIPSETKIVLVGDSAQLPPIGAGLVLHSLLEVREIPVTVLKEVNRYGDKILKAAESIREGNWPELSENINDDICFIPCKLSKIKEKLASLYSDCLMKNTDVKILEPLKAGKYSGTQRTNQTCQEAFAKNSRPVKLWNTEFDQFETISIKEGEPVICTRNHWDKDLQNGSLGKVIEVYTEPREQFNSKNEPTGEAYADIEWDDGVIRALTEDMIDDIILAYSITVHKGQGSQWDTIIVPIYQARNLDRSMLYTAITRAKKKVILLGDLDEAKKITQEPPKAFNRTTGLLGFINECYQ